LESGSKAVAGKAWPSAVYLSAGNNPFSLVKHGVEAAARLSGTSLPLREKELPPSVDLFGWCTWDAFYSTVSAKGIQVGCCDALKRDAVLHTAETFHKVLLSTTICTVLMLLQT